MKSYNSKRYEVGTLLVLCTLASVNAFYVPSPASSVGSIGSWTQSTLHKSKPRRSLSASFASDHEHVLANDDDHKPNHKIVKKEKKSSQLVSTTFNLMKAIIGSGVLTLPAGLAAMSDQRATLFPALAVISVLGAFSAYTFGLYGRLVHSTQARSLGEIWERVKGQKSSWIISLSSMIFCFGACLSYSILLGDAFQALAASGGLSGVAASRPFWVLLVTLTTLLPLCSLQSLSSLAPMSLMGIFGMLATTCFLGWRCPTINAASPYGAEGTLLGTLAKHQLPSFGTFNKGFASPASMILGGMAAASFLGHFSAPDFYHALRKKDDSTDTDDDVAATTSKDSSSTQALQLRDFLKVTVGGFCAVNVINCFIMAFGFLTFGGNSGGVILNNYSTVDPWATVCRLLVAICVIGGYPFLLSACRGEAMALYKRKTQMPATRKVENNITRILLAVLAAGALVMKNAGFVVGLNGALIGSAIVYIFPSLLFLAQTGKSIQLTRRIKLERGFCRFLIAFGIAAGLSGASTSILNQYFPHILS